MKRPSPPSSAGQILRSLLIGGTIHPTSLGCYLPIIDPIVCKKRLTKVLMDRDSGLNILYVDTLDAMRIPGRSSAQ